MSRVTQPIDSLNPPSRTEQEARDTKIKAIVTDLANDLRESVAKIEADTFPTTQNHYGRYMSIISVFAQNDRTMASIISRALKEAGANQAGVNSAMHICFP